MSVEVYLPPTVEADMPAVKREKLGKTLSIIAVILQIGIIGGLTTSLILMLQLFQSITLNGSGDAGRMSMGLSGALVPLLLGMIVALPGLFIASIALFVSSYRSKYTNIYFTISGIFWCLAIPVGTLFGLIFLVILIIKWRPNRSK
ncbi:MotA/TolQ/ExbB proton channel family protein [Pleionea litopenaei]|uniref:MotA/TolQ/ExbB proton channel family protein n=1 Tax=Pleionea litopenaei TaxID=3070815 RepID=A0AA51X5D0_9GAMM|nr:MotA/TolQ/ExbB proton channel family protein [Pleionea sp. HL-JVS1]WMS85763.1 MotA/TolQ/ExbB proton channel family protein [Pleionea sp. HL-JVS1]